MVSCFSFLILFLPHEARLATYFVRICEFAADTVEAYENGELAKLLGIDSMGEDEL